MECVQWQKFKKKKTKRELRRKSFANFFFRFFLPVATARMRSIKLWKLISFQIIERLMCDVWFVVTVVAAAAVAVVVVSCPYTYFNLWVLHIYGHVKSSESVVVDFYCRFICKKKCVYTRIWTSRSPEIKTTHPQCDVWTWTWTPNNECRIYLKHSISNIWYTQMILLLLLFLLLKLTDRNKSQLNAKFCDGVCAAIRFAHPRLFIYF